MMAAPNDYAVGQCGKKDVAEEGCRIENRCMRNGRVSIHGSGGREFEIGGV